MCLFRIVLAYLQWLDREEIGIGIGVEIEKKSKQRKFEQMGNYAIEVSFDKVQFMSFRITTTQHSLLHTLKEGQKYLMNDIDLAEQND